MSRKPTIIELDCYEVRRELVDYMEGDLTTELRRRVEHHLRNCEHCTAIYDGARNVVELLGCDAVLELPPGFGQRLYQRFLSRKG